MLVLKPFGRAPNLWDIPAIFPRNPAKYLFSLGFTGHTELLDPTPARGRPLPYRKISGPNNLSLCSFFLPDLRQASPSGYGRPRRKSGRPHQEVCFLQPW